MISRRTSDQQVHSEILRTAKEGTKKVSEDEKTTLRTGLHKRLKKLQAVERPMRCTKSSGK